MTASPRTATVPAVKRPRIRQLRPGAATPPPERAPIPSAVTATAEPH